MGAQPSTRRGDFLASRVRSPDAGRTDQDGGATLIRPDDTAPGFTGHGAGPAPLRWAKATAGRSAGGRTYARGLPTVPVRPGTGRRRTPLRQLVATGRRPSSSEDASIIASHGEAGITSLFRCRRGQSAHQSTTTVIAGWPLTLGLGPRAKGHSAMTGRGRRGWRVQHYALADTNAAISALSTSIPAPVSADVAMISGWAAACLAICAAVPAMISASAAGFSLSDLVSTT